FEFELFSILFVSDIITSSSSSPDGFKNCWVGGELFCELVESSVVSVF
ncbi:23895_t:CDS:1, partial [Gigaspora rosea]